MFDLPHFVQECQSALNDPNPAQRVEALVREAIADPTVREAFTQSVEVEQHGPISFAIRNANLSVADVTTPPGLKSPAHNHNMWAVIGVYSGQEHNQFFKNEDGKIEAKGERLLKEGDVAVLGPHVIHAIANPLTTISGAIHVYGGDLVEQPGRSMWNPHTGELESYDMDKLVTYVAELSTPQ